MISHAIYVCLLDPNEGMFCIIIIGPFNPFYKYRIFYKRIPWLKYPVSTQFLFNFYLLALLNEAHTINIPKTGFHSVSVFSFSNYKSTLTFGLPNFQM